MILGYLCDRCKGVADKVTQAKYSKDGIDFRLGYVCKECEASFYDEVKANNTKGFWDGWFLSFDFLDTKSVDLMAIYERKEEKLHKKF